MWKLKLNELSKRILIAVFGINILIFVHYLQADYYLLALLFFALYSELLIGCYESKVKVWKRILVFALLYIYISVGIASLTNVVEFNFLPQFIVSVFAIDTSAFVFGKIFKGPKLTSISPNKTWSGAIAGTFTGAFTFYFLLSKVLLPGSQSKLFFGILFAIFVQIGDLFVSFAKRVCDKKEFLNWIPGHGGLWDRCDSIFAGAIFVIFLLYSSIGGLSNNDIELNNIEPNNIKPNKLKNMQRAMVDKLS